MNARAAERRPGLNQDAAPTIGEHIPTIRSHTTCQVCWLCDDAIAAHELTCTRCTDVIGVQVRRRRGADRRLAPLADVRVN
jgi:predicted nucleic acid-binding Zn ribbon protein